MAAGIFEKELILMKREERRFLEKKGLLSGGLSEKLRDKVPTGLEKTVRRAFRAALRYYLEDGEAVLDKTVSREELLETYRRRERTLLERQDYASLRELDRDAGRSRGGNLLLTAAEGAGLGLLGVGLPDIPVFLGVILKTVKETALRYGYAGRGPWEQSCLLRVICGGLCGGEEGRRMFAEAERLGAAMDHRSGEPIVEDVEQMLERTADQLADTLLAAKFVQGIAVVGALGGAFNLTVLQRIERAAYLCYRRRRLEKLRWMVGAR